MRGGGDAQLVGLPELAPVWIDPAARIENPLGEASELEGRNDIEDH